MEEYAWVIEYLPSGRAYQSRREPLVQLIGADRFTLLEATLKPNSNVVLGQKVYVGKVGREEVNHIKSRIGYNELTDAAKEILPNVLKKAIKEKEKMFVSFINNAKPISIRVHTFDLLPGIGKKTMDMLLKERKKQPFESFDDIKKRVPNMNDPVLIFVQRIISELKGDEKYYLFTKPPFKKYEHR